MSKAPKTRAMRSTDRAAKSGAPGGTVSAPPVRSLDAAPLPRPTSRQVWRGRRRSGIEPASQRPR
eukprot:11704458-Alexandrium_andersonii.AAC.1